MIHYVHVKNLRTNKIDELAVSIYCNNDWMKDNTCPTGDGDCVNCKYCVAKMSVGDFFKMQDAIKE